MSTGKTQVAYLKIVVCVDLSVYAPAVAGNWGSWLPWSPCSETCGKGTQSRIRLCNNPPPAFDGPQCEGSDTQTQVCKERPCPGEDARIILSINLIPTVSKLLILLLLLFVPVDGKWSSWVSWGACSVSCGGGTRQRRRLCANPAPQHGGRQCEGNDVHIDFCNSDPCPSESHSLLYSLVKLYKFRILTIIYPLCHYMYISVYL